MDDNQQAQLMAACKKGDPAAYDELIRLYQGRVYSLAMRMLGDPEDAADVTQEAFIRVFRTINKYRGDASPSTWIYRITSNLCLDWLRKRKRRALSSDVPLNLGHGHEAVERQLEDDAPGPEDLMAASELRREIQQALDQLEEHHRLAIVLRDVQGLSYEKVAEILDCPLGTAKSRINRGRLQLKEILQKNKVFQ